MKTYPVHTKNGRIPKNHQFEMASKEQASVSHGKISRIVTGYQLVVDRKKKSRYYICESSFKTGTDALIVHLQQVHG